jgi:formate hydrogenlyase subunit 3/multisubunit Na+/H+ antiporter MnhD subunit
MGDPGVPRAKKTNRLGTIALVVVLLGLLVAATLFAIRSWTSIEGPPLPGVGYVAMTIGVVFSLLIGIALMALLFYSSRHGHDERVQDYSRRHRSRAAVSARPASR